MKDINLRKKEKKRHNEAKFKGGKKQTTCKSYLNKTFYKERKEEKKKVF